MSGKPFTMSQGDLLPKLVLRAVDAANVAVPLGAATAIAAYMQHESTGTRRTLSATISDPPAGEVTITWVTGDTATPGRYRLWIVLTFPGGPETFPSCTDGLDAVYVEICPG